ncbi:hypothetical protein M419DRAFT_118518, partial [Trichoderma reesei RUT C-30]
MLLVSVWILSGPTTAPVTGRRDNSVTSSASLVVRRLRPRPRPGSKRDLTTSRDTQ